MAQSDLIISGVGRFVFGDLVNKVTVGYQNKPIEPDKQQFEFGVAFDKNAPETTPMLQAIAGHAFQEFSNAPHIQAIIQQFNFAAPGFSWKISDGDKPNAKGQVNKNTIGHWVVWLKSSFPIHCVDQQNADIAPEMLKRGFFVQLALRCAGNGFTDTQAGIFINPELVRLIAFGEEIRGGVSADEAFAGHAIPQNLPAGASLTPVAPGPLAQPVSPGQAPLPAPGQMPTQQGLPGGTATAPPNTQSTTGYPGNVQPHPNFADGPPQQPGFTQSGLPVSPPQNPAGVAPVGAPATAPADPSANVGGVMAQPMTGYAAPVAPASVPPGMPQTQPPGMVPQQ